MSNEELVAAIQAGEDCMGELWLQIEKLVRWKAQRIANALKDWGRVELEDLIQSGYLAMVAAVNTYQPGSGTFANWLMYYLRTEFAKAAGYRTDRKRNDPLQHSVSLDAPLGGEDESRLMDMLADPSSAMENQEDALWLQQLHDALDMALDAIPPQCGEVVRARYFDGQSLDDVAQEKNLSAERVRQLEKKGIRLLQEPEHACHLRPFYEFDFYCGTGWQAFKNKGMSVQEQYLVIMEQREKRSIRLRREVLERKWKALGFDKLREKG